MPSIVPNYEYDIFVSYRHNDNRAGGVAEFVELLKHELASTIKQSLSIYFDANPHDGLLETHHVDKSLEGKLKCLIFIPIISQTYCDPKSFAWQHEFCAFNKLAKEDQFGRDIKLANGNVASRILPVRIHDLDAEDNALLEKEIGGRLRAVEFIYREQGVNRPLKVTDEKDDNQCETDYANQLNKVANAIKEIIGALKNTNPQKKSTTNLNSYRDHPTRQPYAQSTTDSKSKNKLTFAGAAILFLLVAGYFFYPKLKSFATPADTLDKSIAVLPFVDMSAAKDQEYFSDGLSEELLNLLSKIPELKVIGRTSSFSFKGKNDDLRSIAEKLGVAHLLEGSVRKSGNKIRITAQLISAVDGSHLWSHTYDRDLNDIFKVQDEIAEAVVKELRVTLLGASTRTVTQNTEAFNLYLQGKYFVDRRDKESLESALQYYTQALALDSNYAQAWAGLVNVYVHQANNGDIPIKEGSAKAHIAVEKALRIDPELSEAHAAQSRIYMSFDLDWPKAEASLKKALELDPGNAVALVNAGILAARLGRSDEAIAFYKRSIAVDPLRARTYNNLSIAFYRAGNLTEAEASVRKSLELNATLSGAYYRLAMVHLAQGKYEAALESNLKESDESWLLSGLPLTYFKLNRKTESDSALKVLMKKYADNNAYQIAEAHAFRGEIDLGFKWLGRAYEQRDPGLSAMKVDPLLMNLRSDARWKPFLKKMGLE